MNLKSMLRMAALHYVMIYGLTMMATYFWCLCFQPEAVIGLDYFWQIMIFALCGDLPIVVFYSRKELTRRQLWIRVVIHAAVLEAALMPVGYFIGMWRGAGGAATFFLTVLAVNGIVHLITYLNAKRGADEINAALRARRKGD